MKKQQVIILLIVLISAVLFFWGINKLQEKKESQNPLLLLDEHENAGVPDFNGVDLLTGKEFSLSSFKGKIVIVNFWATWCAPCIEEFPSMVKLINEFKGQIQLITISADSDKDLAINFINSFKGTGIGFNHMWEPSLDIARKYGTNKLPESYIVGKDMRLIRKVASKIEWSTPEALNYFSELLKNN